MFNTPEQTQGSSGTVSCWDEPSLRRRKPWGGTEASLSQGEQQRWGQMGPKTLQLLSHCIMGWFCNWAGSCMLWYYYDSSLEIQMSQTPKHWVFEVAWLLVFGFFNVCKSTCLFLPDGTLGSPKERCFKILPVRLQPETPRYSLSALVPMHPQPKTHIRRVQISLEKLCSDSSALSVLSRIEIQILQRGFLYKVYVKLYLRAENI